MPFEDLAWRCCCCIAAGSNALPARRSLLVRFYTDDAPILREDACSATKDYRKQPGLCCSPRITVRARTFRRAATHPLKQAHAGGAPAHLLHHTFFYAGLLPRLR